MLYSGNGGRQRVNVSTSPCLHSIDTGRRRESETVFADRTERQGDRQEDRQTDKQTGEDCV